MNTVDVLDDAVIVNGHLLRFPVSYEELKKELGEARAVFNERFGDTDYFYDELGIEFNGSPKYLKELKDGGGLIIFKIYNFNCNN